jgi:hypothetical protein
MFGMGIVFAVGLKIMVDVGHWKQQKLSQHRDHYSLYRLVTALRDDAHRAHSFTADKQQILFEGVNTFNKAVTITYRRLSRGIERIEQEADQQVPSRKEVFVLPVEKLSAVRHREGLVRVDWASPADSWSLWLRLGRDQRWGARQIKSSP